MKILRTVALAVDSWLERFALTALLTMILIMVMQVFTRKLFSFVFFWSEETILLLLVWFSFIGMAIGFREYIHLGIDSFTNLLPDKVNKVLDKIIDLVNFSCGLYFVVYGWQFTVLMSGSTLAATKWPNSLLYAVMPVCGLMICVYTGLHFVGINTKRHHGTEVEVDMGLDMGVGEKLEEAEKAKEEKPDGR